MNVFTIELLPPLIIDRAHSQQGRVVVLNQEQVADYADAMERGEKLPRVVLYRAGKAYRILDGRHRIEAAMKLKLAKIECEVWPPMTDKDAWIFSLQYNIAHGLPLTNADKRMRVEKTLEFMRGSPSTEIAKLCGVSHGFVDNVRRPKLSEKEAESQPATVAAGNATPPVNQPASSPSKSSTPNKPANTGPAAPPAKTPAPPKEEPKIVDSLDFIIPEQILPIWNRKHEVQDALSMLSKIKAGLEAAIEEKDPLYAGLSHGEYQTAISDLKNVRSTIQLAMPYAVCPNCQGVNPARKNCRQCRASGFVSKFSWDQQVPKELKAMRKLAIAKQEEKKK